MCATAIVIPRAFSSGALSIESKLRNFTFGLCLASTLVMAAVRVVLPWSIWPIVPILTCGLLRSNFSFAICLEKSPYLSRDLPLNPAYDLLGDLAGDLLVLSEMHGETAAALGTRTQLGGVSEHLRERHHR